VNVAGKVDLALAWILSRAKLPYVGTDTAVTR
jgi:hypothetical protein